MVNSICLDKFTRSSWSRPPRIVSFYSWFPCIVKVVVTAQNAPDTTEAHVQFEYSDCVVLDNFSTTLDLLTQLEHRSDSTHWKSPRMAVRSR